MILRNHTGLIRWPLSAKSGGINPTFTQGQEVAFKFDDVPVLTDRLPNYLPAVEIEISGTYTNNDTGETAIAWDEVLRGFINNLRLENAWHGTPILDTHWVGSILDGLEFLHNGYNYWSPRGVLLDNVNSQPIVRSFIVPLYWGHGEKPHHTAQLALFYRNAQLLVRTAAASVFTSMSAPVTFSGLTMRAYALLLPDPELRIGPGVQHVLYRDNRSDGNQTYVSLDSFGNKHGLDGAELGAGVGWLGYYTSVNGQPGPIAGNTITDFGFAARNQRRVQGVRSFVNELRDAIGGRSPRLPMAVTTAQMDMNGWPWTDRGQDGGAAQQGDPLNSALRVFPMGIIPHREQEFTKVQVFEGTQSFELVDSSGSTGGTHVIGATQFHSWTPQKLEDALREIRNFDNGRLLRAVFGKANPNVEWAPKLTRKQVSIDARKARFLPLKLAEKAA